MNIFLIGYRCSGKTEVGKSLALRMGHEFIDTDDKIVKDDGWSIAQIVEQQGWNAFREKERAVIKLLCRQDRLVVATGGGAVLDKDNVKDMKNAGLLVWLKAKADTIKKRMCTDERTGDLRPPLSAKGRLEEIEDMLPIRNAYYELAMDFYVETDDRSVDEVCDFILKRIGEYPYAGQ